ncbi:C40 family peptidase [Pseudonocardia sp. TRM90224]|uniref:C40 family peptidase n=1 Tax=Pseudonocardia sp. TRM90224 TaxID=2812678 RepID=UPI001E56BF06|nr:bifunctional lytic transglycosylase/C40 family peptidase [Pseudonocardia sp. TRM90224]
MSRVVLILAAVVGVVVLLVAVGLVALSSAVRSVIGGVPSTTALEDIPPSMAQLYHAAAATCPGLDWAVLAAVGKVETDHGRSPLPGVSSGENPAGAGGPMQFLAATFADVVARHPPPSGGATPPSRYNPSDAVHAAAAYLCDSGAHNGDLRTALFTYNHDSSYVDQVLAQADIYRAPVPQRDAGTAAYAALAYAHSHIGQPYLWGGDGPAAGEAGFDCSGLTTAAYAAAGITLPRTAQTQYNTGPLLPPGAPLAAGDLLFFGTPAGVHHVGIATGQATLMVHAPHAGATVTIGEASAFPDFLAASRPVSRSGTESPPD